MRMLSAWVKHLKREKTREKEREHISDDQEERDLRCDMNEINS